MLSLCASPTPKRWTPPCQSAPRTYPRAGATVGQTYLTASNILYHGSRCSGASTQAIKALSEVENLVVNPADDEDGGSCTSEMRDTVMVRHDFCVVLSYIFAPCASYLYSISSVHPHRQTLSGDPSAAQSATMQLVRQHNEQTADNVREYDGVVGMGMSEMK